MQNRSFSPAPPLSVSLVTLLPTTPLYVALASSHLHRFMDQFLQTIFLFLVFFTGSHLIVSVHDKVNQLTSGNPLVREARLKSSLSHLALSEVYIN